MNDPEYQRAWYLKNRTRLIEKQKVYAANNRKRRREWARKARKKNREKILIEQKIRRDKNLDALNAWRREYYRKHRETIRQQNRQWEINNPWKARAKCARRHANKINAVPPWVEMDKITFVYKKARELGLHVDHIVPLQSHIVCGLHCWENLQLLSIEENSRKHNKIWPDMP